MSLFKMAQTRFVDSLSLIQAEIENLITMFRTSSAKLFLKLGS